MIMSGTPALFSPWSVTISAFLAPRSLAFEPTSLTQPGPNNDTEGIKKPLV